MNKNILTEPAPYAIGVAIAFTLLAPSGAQTPSSSTAAPFGVLESCAEDNCEPYSSWICIHGAHRNEDYRDPL